MPKRRIGLAIGVAALLATVVAVVVAVAARDDAPKVDGDRQAAVAERGRQVMPFDLDRSTHRFVKTADGGVQTVISDDGDPNQITLIRAHLRKEARLFRNGVFNDPMTIHGPDMAGIRAIRAGAARIEIAYVGVASGARLRYRTNEPELIDAIHRWFDAQVSDHGAHADGDH